MGPTLTYDLFAEDIDFGKSFNAWVGMQKERNSRWNWRRTNETDEKVNWTSFVDPMGNPNGKRNLNLDVTCSSITVRTGKPSFWESGCAPERLGICMTGKCLDLDIIE